MIGGWTFEDGIFELKVREIIKSGERIMFFFYRDNVFDIYKDGIIYRLIDYQHKNISEIDYKDLETIRALLLNCNIKFD